MSGPDITLGFIPLTDAALPILAAEMGFAAEEGLSLALVRETSWATIRDKVAMGVYPAAHMLSPLAIALTAGVGPHRAPMVAPMLLGTNGNTLTATTALADTLVEHGARFGDAQATGAALARYARQSGLRVGVPFPHSMHRELMRLLLDRSGATGDISFLTAPPRVLPQVLAAGEVDVFVVGEPWGSLAVDQGVGEILLTGAHVWSATPEKVLALDKAWADSEPERVSALVRALYRASMWLEQPGSVATAAEILALPQYLDTSAVLLERALAGRMVIRAGHGATRCPDVLNLSGPSAIYPWQSAAAWIALRAAAGWGLDPIRAQAAALETFRPDLLHLALEPLGTALPLAHQRVEGRTMTGDEMPGTRGAIRIQPSRFFDRSEFSLAP